MLDIQRVKELLGTPDLPDSVAEALRDACRAWAEVVFETLEHLSQQRDATSAAEILPNGAKHFDSGHETWYKSSDAGNHLHTSEQ